MSPVMDLARQTARAWASALGAAFADPATPGAVAASVYACALPPRRERLSPGMSVTIASGGDGPDLAEGDVVRRVMLACECRAASIDDAMAALDTLREMIRPGQRRWSDGGLTPGAPGLIGLPPAAIVPDAGLDCWRILGWSIVSDAQPLQLAGLPESAVGGGGSTEEGEAAAMMTIECAAVPASVAGAFTLLRPAGGGVTQALAEVRGGALTLTITPGGPTVISLVGRTIAQAAALAASAGWTVSAANAGVSALPALNIVGFAAAPALAPASTGVRLITAI